jgi:hypothetical protein
MAMSPALSKSGRAILKEIEYTESYREYFWQSIGERPCRIAARQPIWQSSISKRGK